MGLLVTLLLACNAANAADRMFSVMVSVPVKNEFTDRVKSLITKELLKLPDVRLVSKLLNGKDQYRISVVAVPSNLESGVTIGIVVSHVFQDDDSISHSVLTGAPDDLEDLCEALVANFDTAFLEPERHKGPE